MDNSVLTFKEYNIGGNVLRAYYDADEKLVFVLDSTVDDRKPNALLVINPVGDRKWDDILANDYGVDLETVRPKKNNKYQKLDIEYSGLAEYDNLINAYENGDDLTAALMELAAFREDSVRRAANERLATAELSAERARETITRARESIDELQAKLRTLRAQLAQQKKKIGREPTKQSASKILRTDAQIDATGEKLRRAKKRLANAQRRLIVADEDAEIAREILSRGAAERAPVAGAIMPQSQPSVTTTYNISYDDADETDKTDDVVDTDESLHYSTEIAAPVRTDVVATDATDDNHVARMPDDADEYEDSTDVTEYKNEEPKAENMADETVKNDNDEVQPLLDENPEILDEDIAFKPIAFGVSSPVESDDTQQQNAEMYDSVIDEKPLSFTPPVSNNATAGDQAAPINVRPVTDMPEQAATSQSGAPVLDTITSVDVSVPQDNGTAQLDSELMAGISQPKDVAAPTPNPVAEPAPVAPAAPVQDAAPAVAENARPVPPAATAQNAAAVRPVSPITGNAQPTNPAPRKPTLVYYILLILLIALSVFALWLYQKNTSDQAPDLTTTVTEQQSQNATSKVDESLLPQAAVPQAEVQPTDVQVAEPAPVAEPEPVVEPEPVAVPEPVVEPEPEPEVPDVVVLEPEQTESADIVIESVSVAAPAPVAEPEPVVIETEEEILANKPAYNVSQNENMFVADEEYDTETLRNANMVAVDTTGPSVVSAPTTQNATSGALSGVYSSDDYVPQSVTSMVWEEEVETPSADVPTCPDGTAPDINGCCSGEVYTDMGEMGFNCCPQSGGDCFPPLI